MKWTLNRKLAMIFFVTHLVLVGVIAVATHLSFKQGLLAYLNRTGAERIEALSELLTDHYLQNGSRWEALQQNPEQWHRLLRLAHHKFGAPPPDEKKPPKKKKHHKPKHRPDLLGMKPRYTLVDVDSAFLAGVEKPASDAERLDRDFVSHQRLALIVIGLCAGAISLALAYFLSRHLPEHAHWPPACDGFAVPIWWRTIANRMQDSLQDLTGRLRKRIAKGPLLMLVNSESADRLLVNQNSWGLNTPLPGRAQISYTL